MGLKKIFVWFVVVFLLLLFLSVNKIVPAVENSGSSCVVPPSGMTGWWPGDGNANDIAASNNGTLQNDATFADGKVSQAFSFDGSDDYIEMPSSVGDFGSSPFTVDFWMYSNNAGYGVYLMGRSHPDGGQGWDIRFHESKIRLEGTNGWDPSYNWESDASITPNLWHHVAVSSTDSLISVYIDGVFKGTTSRSSISSAVNPFRIGYTTNYGGYPFNGLIDEVEIFNRALSQDEIASIFNAGSLGKCKNESTPNLYFSEYIEGSSNNKALEIYNNSGSTVDLAAGDYKVEIYNNGHSLPDTTINLSGTVTDGNVFVLSHSSADASILAVAWQTAGNVNFNGDDAVVLKKTDTILDVIGQVGFDPGVEWGSGSTTTKDHTLVRKCSVTQGDNDGSDPFDPSSQWEGFSQNTFINIGAPTNCELVTTARLRAFKYFDADQNGSYDGEDYPLEGWRISLYNDRGATYISDRVTGADGYTDYWEDVPVEDPNELVLQEQPAEAGWIAINPSDEGGYGTYWDGEVVIEVGGTYTFSFGNWHSSDMTAPSDPADVHSTSHQVEIQSNNNNIQMAWSPVGELDGASDDSSGVDGYSYSFTNNPEDLPDDIKDAEEEAAFYSESLVDGTWYFHLRTVDNANNWTLTVHSGPYIIDTNPPISTLNSPSGGSFWGSGSFALGGGILIEGSSSDVTEQERTVSHVTLWAYSYSDDNWFEIATFENFFEEEPFNWFYTWFPEFEDYYDIMAEATDKAGNTDYSENAYAEEVVYDLQAPVSTINTPSENSFHQSPITISGETADSFSVDYVRLFRRNSQEEGSLDSFEDSWTEIDTNPEEEGIQPLSVYDDGQYRWNFDWTPDSENTFDIKAEATDRSGNTEQSPVVRNVTYDTTDPISNITYPEEGISYAKEEWEGKIKITGEDNLSGIAGVLISILRDSDNKYWDGDDDEDGTGWRLLEDEYLNEASLSEDGKRSYDFAFIEPEEKDEGYTVRSHAVDNAQNQEDTTEVHYFFGRPPVISGETESSVSTSSVTINWTTDFPATSRVIYDTVSHSVMGEAPNYGYLNSTIETDNNPKVTSHSVGISGLTSGTTFYYRTVSHGSPEKVGEEKSFTTTAIAGTVAGSSIASSSNGNTVSAPACNDTKPGSAPVLLSAVGGLNNVILVWSKATEPVSYYLVAYGTSPGLLQFGNPNVGVSNATSYTVNGLSGGTTYYFKVRAGNGCAPGEFSNEVSATPFGEPILKPAEDFTEGILGVETVKEESMSEEKPETYRETKSEVLGSEISPTLTQASFFSDSKNWLGITISLVALIFIGFFLLKTKKQN